MNKFTAVFVSACLLSGAFWTSWTSSVLTMPITAFGMATSFCPELGEMYKHNMSILLGTGSKPMDDEVKNP